MTLSPELFNAILSMDAYSRGYDASINLSGNAVGNAQVATMVNDLGETVTLDSSVLDDSDQSIGFYALAYNYDGGTIISFRGTDYPQEDTLVPKDIHHGWSLGGGNTDSEQAQGKGGQYIFYSVALTNLASWCNYTNGAACPDLPDPFRASVLRRAEEMTGNGELRRLG